MKFAHTILPQIKFWLLISVPVIAIVLAVFLIEPHARSKDFIAVSLYEQSGGLPVQENNTSDNSQSHSSILRVAISGVISPSLTLKHYQELLTHLERNLGRQITLTLKPTYAEINDLIQGERIDIAFICSLAYVKGREDFGMELLVAPQVRGQTVYYSYLIVSQDSLGTSLEDLRGGNFAFTDLLSNSGHLVPTYQLSLLGESPVSFFKQHIYTYSHDNSIVAIADKLVDGAAVDSLVYDYLAISNPKLISKTKVIRRWGPYGVPPVVVSPMLDSQLRQELQDFFLDFHNSTEGDRILKDLGIDSFVIVSDSIYDSIREMKHLLGW
jgi:phosphonate transport system substrate-binding protein